LLYFAIILKDRFPDGEIYYDVWNGHFIFKLEDIYYIIDYTKNDKYIIQSFNHFNIKSDKEEEERNKNDFYNPTINFTLDIEVYFEGKYYHLDYEKFGTNLKIK